MRLTRAAQGATLTRYWISAHLGPQSLLMLVDPDNGDVAASWMSGVDSEVVRGVWLSSLPGLVGLVDGHDHDDGGDHDDISDRELDRLGRPLLSCTNPSHADGVHTGQPLTRPTLPALGDGGRTRSDRGRGDLL